MQRLKYFIGISFIVFLFSCKDAYRPDIISNNRAYLVVEGVLNVSGPASVTLSRTTPISGSGFLPVNGAQLSVEGRDNSVRPLTQQTAGVYTSANLNLVLNNEYRLRIRTQDGKEYLSEYVVARQTPVIDSVGWKRETEGVRLYVNTHDASGNTRYYRWDYDETWEINSYHFSRYIYVGNGIVRERSPQEEVYRCWKYNNSKNILIGSSAKLQSDIIFQSPVNFIANGSEKLDVRYSVIVRQYAIDKTAYDFYDLMKRNTENLGTIFDPQPSETRGNITCISNPDELVIGFITSSTVTEKRIFISNSDLPDWRYDEYCPLITVVNRPDSIAEAYGTGSYMPVDAVFSPFNPNQIIGYLSSYPSCVDCTKRNGSLAKPSYW